VVYNGDMIRRVITLVLLAVPVYTYGAQTVTFTMTGSDTTVTIPQREVRGWFSLRTQLVFDSTYTAILEPYGGATACPMPHPGCVALQSSRWVEAVRKTEVFTPRYDDIMRFLDRVAQDMDIPPQDARFRMGENGRVDVFRPHRMGRALSREEAVDVIAQYARAVFTDTMPSEIRLPSHEVSPQFTTASVNDLGITTLLAEGRSDFAGSPATRVHNIRTAARRFNGVILAPGEELSFGKLLGVVDGSTGYAKELVIKGNKTTPEYGGGICQVSSTLFRAAIFAGFEITQRRNHSYAVKYYRPTGFDATVYAPYVDLRFKNNTKHHVLLQNSIEGTELIFRVYGTPDGRTVEMTGPFVTEKNPDGSMKTYFTQTVIRADGTVMIDDIFYSNYKSPKDYPIQKDVAKPAPLTKKPDNWSKKQWRAYRNAHR